MVKLIVIENNKERLIESLEEIKQKLIQGYLQGYSGTLNWDFIPEEEDEI